MGNLPANSVLIVCEPDDSFADALEIPIAEADLLPVRMSSTAASQLFTIRVQGGDVSVAPELPMVIRAPRQSSAHSADARFLHSEALGALWAVAALSRAPVLGRPSAMGFGGGCSLSASITELRGGLRTDRKEVFMQGASWPQSDSGWYFKSPDALEPLNHEQRAAYPGPQRGRHIRPGEQYESVLVLRQQAWCRSGMQIADHDLAKESVVLAEQLDLDIALVMWALSEDLGDPYLARITPWPHRAELDFAWDPFVAAVVSHLTQ